MNPAPADTALPEASSWWSVSPGALYSQLQATLGGLTSDEAAQRLLAHGRNSLDGAAGTRWGRQLLQRFASPLVIILIVAAGISLLVHEWVDACIVLGIVFLTTVLSYFQEMRASHAVDALRSRVALQTRVLRDGRWQSLPAVDVVPGDVVELSAGDLVPADARVLEAHACHVEQALLTGETLPAEKTADPSPAGCSIADCSNGLFMGTSLRSGQVRAVVVNTGRRTRMGEIADRLSAQTEDTDFERGLRRFGGMLIGIMLTVVVAVLAVNILLHKPGIDTLLFAAALAVGLSPELLPAILTVTLSHGAREMAKRGVIVKRLNAIENLGSMDVLCTDKTGTLTRGVMELDLVLDVGGSASPHVMQLAAINAALQTGMRNPLDEAVVARWQKQSGAAEWPTKLDEIPYDFQARRLSVVVADATQPGGALLVCKGAVGSVADLCSCVRQGENVARFDTAQREAVNHRFEEWSARGYRVLAVASRPVSAGGDHSRNDEADMVLEGFLLFFDPPEAQVGETLQALRTLGVDVRIISGDNRHVTRHVADAIGMPVAGMLTGSELQQMSDEALWHLAPRTTLFTEIDPAQKERIIRALQHNGHVVGYLGDGINDAPALQAADVGISVDRAADVAREAADFVLLSHDLGVLRAGIDEGRRTFANTLKYIFITTSANFGNMVSMAMASLFLPFLPLLAKQILLNNFLSDVPSMGIASDNVDPEWESTPHRWDIALIRNSMITFGLVSTVFDLTTFWALLHLSDGNETLFRTGWFVESLLTELLVLFILRTTRPFHRSVPGRFLMGGSAVTALITLWLPYSPLAAMMGFAALPLDVAVAIIGITLAYVCVSEAVKRWFFRRHATQFV